MGIASARSRSAEAARGSGARSFRDVMGRFATGVTIVTTTTSDGTFGMTANAFMAVSLTPPLCVVSVNRSAVMHATLLEARRFGVSVLAEGQRELANHFAGRPLDAGAPEFVEHAAMPVMRDAIAIIVAELVEATAAGDHTLFVGEVSSMAVTAGAPPLLFYRGRYARIDEADGEKAPVSPFW